MSKWVKSKFFALGPRVSKTATAIQPLTQILIPGRTQRLVGSLGYLKVFNGPLKIPRFLDPPLGTPIVMALFLLLPAR